MLKETEFRKTGLALLAWGMFWVLLTAFNAFAEDISVSARVNKTDLTLEDSIILSVIVRGAQKSPPPATSFFNRFSSSIKRDILIVPDRQRENDLIDHF